MRQALAILEAVTVEPAATTAVRSSPPARPTWRGWLVWSVGVLGYVLAVAQRTSFGVAGLEAADRFAVDPGMLAAFVFVQLTVYIAAQIPAGLAVDRFGARIMLTVSGGLLATGQLLLALTTDLSLAVLARVLVGAGDAVVFSAVFSLVPRWFPGPKVSVYAQVTGMLCQLGQVLSAVPFAALLHLAGWGVAFGTAAAVSLVGAALAFAVVRNDPAGTWAPAAGLSPREIGRQLRAVWRRPGTRVGFFGHVGAQFSMMVFTLLWGVPYLQIAHRLSVAQVGALLTLFVLCMIGIGPLLGVLASRHPLRRSWLVLGVIGAEASVWTVVLAQPGPAPGWLLVLLVVVLAAAGPASMVGIDISRTSNPTGSLGVAQSMTNLGGFLASLVVLAGMGAIMSAMGGFTPEAFRVAWLLQYPVWALAVVGLLYNRRRARALDAQRGVVPRRVRDVLARSR